MVAVFVMWWRRQSKSRLDGLIQIRQNQNLGTATTMVVLHGIKLLRVVKTATERQHQHQHQQQQQQSSRRIRIPNGCEMGQWSSCAAAAAGDDYRQEHQQQQQQYDDAGTSSHGSGDDDDYNMTFGGRRVAGRGPTTALLGPV